MNKIPGLGTLLRHSCGLLALACLGTGLGAQDLAGRWEGEIPFSGKIELEPYALELQGDGSTVTGRFFFVGQEFPLQGTLDRDTGAIALHMPDYEDSADFTLVLEEDVLRGEFVHSRIGSARMRAVRPEEETGEEPLVVDFSRPRPETVELAGLDEELAGRIRAVLLRELDGQDAVGLSAAIVRDGEVIDVRAYGWEDYHNDVAATGATQYRWASISKPLTAVAALQLAEAGKLDLDEDVRTYVPEFPELRWPFTTRQLLCHQSGITHYRNMQLRTLREYDHPHPWTDEIIALDMFNESPLLFEPGTRFSYTTPGYVLLGAVVAKAAGQGYAAEVTKNICEPLGMSTMQPDRQWGEAIPHRSRGYHREGDRVVDSGDNNISWKLAAGGWISTVGDLGRFGAGLMGPELLSVETQLAMWEAQRTDDGTPTDYGLGVGVSSVGDVKTISHSGGQRKTSTFLICAPDHGLAVALMCNTSGTGLGGVAQEILEMLIANQDG